MKSYKIYRSIKQSNIFSITQYKYIILRMEYVNFISQVPGSQQLNVIPYLISYLR